MVSMAVGDRLNTSFPAVPDTFPLAEPSSFRMVLVRDWAPRSRKPLVTAPRLTVKSSLGSSVESPATGTVMVVDVWPPATVAVPDGKVPPTKAAPVTAEPLTDQATVAVPVLSADRVKV